jgi:hypothetical protein
VAEVRLTREECQLIADRILEAIGDVDAAEALRRFGGSHVARLEIDEVRSKPYHCMTFASRLPDDRVALWVSVTPEPHTVRCARRFQALARLIEGWRYARSGASSHRLIPTADAAAPQSRSSSAPRARSEVERPG